MSDSDSQDWEAWESDQEGDFFSAPVKDLFSDRVFENAAEFLEYNKVENNFDLQALFKVLRVDTYGRVRLINYLRKNCDACTPNELFDKAIATVSEWKDSEDLLLPTLPEDGLLQYAVMLDHGLDDDSELEWKEECEDGEEQKQTISIENQQKYQIKQLNTKVEELETIVARMTSLLQDLTVNSSNTGSSTSSSAAETPTAAGSTGATKIINAKVSAQDDVDANDRSYFGGYSTHHIHEEMLKDKHRTETYRDALFARPDLLKDKVVLDVGCGTGILSMFAAKAGAKLVIGVDAADIIDKTREIVKMNNLDDKIKLVKGKVEELTLPVHTVDVIVSEWMGYFLVYESMLPSVYYARDKWLRRETGISYYEDCINKNIPYDFKTPCPSPFAATSLLFPDVARMYLTGVNTRALISPMQEFWQDVYGFNMSVMTPIAVSHPSVNVDVLPKPLESTLTDTQGILHIDLMNTNSEDLVFESDVTLKIEQEDVLDCILVWFDTIFSSKSYRDHINANPTANYDITEPKTKYNSYILTTSQLEQPTHWRQSLFWLQHVFQVSKGDIMNVKIVATTGKKNHRHYDVKLTYELVSTNAQPTTPCPVLNKQWGVPHTKYTQEYSLE